MTSVTVPELMNTDSREMRRRTMQFMREVNINLRNLEDKYEKRIKKLEEELRSNG